MTEDIRVLVTYAAVAGSTRGIAERIAGRLRDVAEVVVRPADPDLDVRGFHAFVVGSAVHDMAWLPAARHFPRRARASLGDRPLWCFSVGGVVVLAGPPLWGRLFRPAVGGRPGDHRDRAAVDRWADGIATALAGLRPAPHGAGDERPAASGTSVTPPVPGR